jgi:Periplasmic binding protein-like domain
VVGCDNLPIASRTVPPLTIVDIHFYDLGAAAMGLLLELIKSGDAQPRNRPRPSPDRRVTRERQPSDTAGTAREGSRFPWWGSGDLDPTAVTGNRRSVKAKPGPARTPDPHGERSGASPLAASRRLSATGSRRRLGLTNGRRLQDWARKTIARRTAGLWPPPGSSTTVARRMSRVAAAWRSSKVATPTIRRPRRPRQDRPPARGGAACALSSSAAGSGESHRRWRRRRTGPAPPRGASPTGAHQYHQEQSQRGPAMAPRVHRALETVSAPISRRLGEVGQQRIPRRHPQPARGPGGDPDISASRPRPSGQSGRRARQSRCSHRPPPRRRRSGWSARASPGHAAIA